MNNPLYYIDPSGHDPCQGGSDPSTIGQSCTSSWGPDPMDSVIRLKVYYSGRSTPLGSGGVAVAPNAILTHNHLDSLANPIENVLEIEVFANDGTMFTLDQGDFSFAGDSELGGGLALIVFDGELPNYSNMGGADLISPGMDAQQAVATGATPGLYGTEIQNPDAQITNLRGVTYDAITVAPDKTVGGDSGMPLFVNDQVYGVNNSGEGIYGAINNPGFVRKLISRFSNKYRWE